MNSDIKVDCFGLLCPVPIIRTAKEMKELAVGQVLEVTSTDEGIGKDMPAWCKMTGQEFLGLERDGDVYRIYVR
jgi:TusA-related sulfurtransferase